MLAHSKAAGVEEKVFEGHLCMTANWANACSAWKYSRQPSDGEGPVIQGLLQKLVKVQNTFLAQRQSTAPWRRDSFILVYSLCNLVFGILWLWALQGRSSPWSASALPDVSKHQQHNFSLLFRQSLPRRHSLKIEGSIWIKLLTNTDLQYVSVCSQVKKLPPL